MAMQTQASNNEYYLVAMDNCEVVLQVQMTDEQIKAMHDLEKVENVMDKLEGPLEHFEDEMEVLSEQLEEITALAFHEDGDTLTINRKYLKEQELIASKIEELADSYEDEFDAIEEQGGIIEELAENFENVIEPSLEGVDYDRISILEPGEDLSDIKCKNNRIVYLR